MLVSFLTLLRRVLCSWIALYSENFRNSARVSLTLGQMMHVINALIVDIEYVRSAVGS
jgi:hypothetical protein